MKTFILVLAAGAICAMSCQQQSGEAGTQTGDSLTLTDTVPLSSLAAGGPQCFIQVVGKDTARLSFEVSGDSVNGKLAYQRYEKDSNKGTIRGVVQGNILQVQYTFMSEGVESVNQAMFKVDGDKVYEGRAKDFDKEGRPVFGNDLGKVEWDSAGFVRGECWYLN
ncbi:hypothetical protein [uncultured Chitinophaga sp.]|jgi:hypothetical protein|uniref:hypothetical protein n=1 Tax=uncultured Chitinophaga sp. TaxID=339340 RepID=UPI00262EFE12|nr:hypothetical protein [uncultured Chitinophaga sp.]